MAPRARWIDAHAGEPIFALPIREHGRLGTRIVVGEEALEAARAEVALEEALALAGAWDDLDFDEMMDDFERIRHASPPSPPIDEL